MLNHSQDGGDDHENESGSVETHDDESTSEASTQVQNMRRSTRVRQPTQRYSPSLYYALFTDAGEPESFHEAVNYSDKAKWLEAMEDEMGSLHLNETWELVELPK